MYPQAELKRLAAGKAALLDGLAVSAARDRVREIVEATPDVSLEYFELADSVNLNLLDDVEQSESPIMCIAGYVGDIRLIDNMFLDAASPVKTTRK